MNYPLELLPNINYKLIDCDLSESCLIRHTSLSQNELLDDTGKLKDIAIVYGAEQNLPDFSTSLLGIFSTDHISIKITNTKYYMEYCLPNDQVNTPVFNEDFEIVENRGFWTIPIGLIHNQQIEYHDDKFNAICKVLHSPMKWNFWHFSINWYINEIGGFWHNNIDFQTKSIRRLLISEIRSLIKEHGKAEDSSKNIINQDCYSINN